MTDEAPDAPKPEDAEALQEAEASATPAVPALPAMPPLGSEPDVTPNTAFRRVQRLAKIDEPALPPTLERPAIVVPPTLGMPVVEDGSTAAPVESQAGRRFVLPPTRLYDTPLTRRLEGRDDPLPGPPPLRGGGSSGRWQRWRKRAIVTLVALVALRLVLALVLDFALDFVCRELLGITCRVGHSTLRLASGEAVFEDLALETPGGQPVATVGRAELDVRWSELPRIVIHRAVLEDAKLTLRREADGSMPALAELADLIAKKKDEPKKTSRPPRVVLEAVRVTHGRVEWEDLSTSPRLRETVELEARADDLALDGSHTERPARVSVRLAAPGILDAFRLDAAARTDGEARIVDLALSLEGHPRLLASYLAPRARPEAHQVSLDLSGRLVVRPPLLEGVEGDAADLTIERVSLKADEDELGFDRLVASARRLAKGSLEVSSIAVDRPRGALARLAGGALRIGGFSFPPRPALLSRDESGAAAAAESAKPPSASTSAFSLPDLVVDEVALHGGSFHFTDEAVTPRVDIVAHDIEASLRELVKDEKRPDARAKLDVSLGVDRAVDGVRLSGEVAPFASPRRASLGLSAHGLTLRALDPWLARAGIESGLASGALSARLEASVADDARGLTIDAELADLVLSDGTERAGIASVKVAGATFEPASGTLDVKALSVSKPRVRVERQASGAIAFLGLRTRAAPESAAAERSAGARSALLRHVAVSDVTLSEGGCVFVDHALAAPVELALERGTVRVSGVAFDASAATSAAPAHVTASAHLVRSGSGSVPAAALGDVSLDAALVADPAAPALSGTLTALHLAPKPLAPYLERAAIEPLLEEGRLEAHIEASARTDGLALHDASVVIERLALSAPSGELAAVDRLALTGGGVRAVERRIDLGAIALEGVRARVARVAEGAVDAFGLRFKSRPPSSEPEGTPLERGDPAPRVQWGEVTLSRAALLWTDETVQPAVTLRVRELDASLGARHFDHEDAGGAPPLDRPAPFKLHAAVEDAVASLDLAGGLVPSSRAPVLFADVHAKGVTLHALTPYLARAGLAPALASGDLRARIEASANLTRPSLRANVLVRDLALSDERSELAALARASLAIDMERAARELTLSAVRVERPRLFVRRSPEGGLSLLGFSLGGGRATTHPDVSPPGEPLGVTIDGARVDELALHFEDEHAGARLDLVHGRVELAPARLGARAESAPFTLHADVEGAATLDASGVARLDATAPSVSATVALAHVRGAKLDPYLRDAGTLLLADGALDAHVSFEKTPAAEGGAALHALVERVELRDGERRLLSWRELRADVPRLDHDVLLIDALSLGGVEGQLERLADGRVRVAGLELRAPRPRAAAPVAPVTAVLPPVAPSAASEPPAGELDLDDEALPRLPRVEVRGFALGVDRFSVYDRAGGSTAPPFVVRDLSVFELREVPFLLAHETRASALLLLHGQCRVEGMLERAHVQLQCLPFDSEPQLALDLSVEGFSGPALMERAPELAARIDPSALGRASLHAYLAAFLKNRRRVDALLGNLAAQPLAFEATLSDLEARGTPDGPVLLGLDELHVDATGWNVVTGEARLRAVELSNPSGRLRREPEGWRFLDVVWKSRGEDEAAPAPSSSEPSPELRIDRLAITDGDLLLEDGSVKPESSLPLGALEIEVTGFSSRLLHERRPARVRVAARGGTFFEELNAHGVLTFFPQLDGDLDANLLGVKVARLSGYTLRAWKLGLKEGRIDADARLRLRNGHLACPMRYTLTDVQVEEPDEGSVVGQKAGVSVKTALALLRDDDDVVALDVPLQMEFDGLHAVGNPDFPGIFGNALGAAVKGIGSAPLAAMESVGKSIKGAVAGRDEDERKTTRVAFDPADARLPDSSHAELDALAARLKSDEKLRVALRAEVGVDDEERAKKLGAPTPAERADLIARLEARRGKLEAHRQDAEAEVRAALLAGAPDAIGPARARHARAARAVQEADRSLDALYDQERDVRGRSGERRTHDVAQALCDARVEAVRAYLVAQGASVEQIKPLRPRLKPGEENTTGRVTAEVQSAPIK